MRYNREEAQQENNATATAMKQNVRKRIHRKLII